MQITITRSLVQTNTKQVVLSGRWFAIYYLTTVLDVLFSLSLSLSLHTTISPSHSLFLLLIAAVLLVQLFLGCLMIHLSRKGRKRFKISLRYR